jgi:ABC-type transport system involved in cytochrome c biogenesis permease subunit
MSWTNFPMFALLSGILWLFGLLFIDISRKNPLIDWIGRILLFAGLIVLVVFISILWINLGRPPLRTLGETRLWYSMFLPVIGLITYFRWNYKWFLNYAIFLAILFLIINYLHPETYEKTLMPALQSPWFVPHVIVYIFSYALLAASSLVGVFGLYQLYFKNLERTTLRLADNLVYIGFAFLTFGLLFGALWAKEAWGHYWTWDPKETWAFLTWLSYLIYLHFRIYQPRKVKTPLWALSLAFIVLLICWFGINYLPSAQNSVHVYAR